MEVKVTNHILKNMLRERFRSKKEMADTLDIQYRMLLRVFSSDCSRRDLSLVMDKVILYCVEHDVRMENALHSFFS